MGCVPRRCLLTRCASVNPPPASRRSACCHSSELEMSKRFGGFKSIMFVHLFFVVRLEILVALQGRSISNCRSGKGNPDTGMPFIHAHAPSRNQTRFFGIILRDYAKDHGPSFKQMPITGQFSDRFAGAVHHLLTQVIFYVHRHTHRATVRTVDARDKAGLCRGCRHLHQTQVPKSDVSWRGAWYCKRLPKR